MGVDHHTNIFVSPAATAEASFPSVFLPWMKHGTNPAIALDGPPATFPDFPDHSLTFPWHKQSPDYNHAADVHMTAVNSRQNDRVYFQTQEYHHPDPNSGQPYHEATNDFHDPFGSNQPVQHQPAYDAQLSMGLLNTSVNHVAVNNASFANAATMGPGSMASAMNMGTGGGSSGFHGAHEGNGVLATATAPSGPESGAINSSSGAINVSSGLGSLLAYTNDMMSSGYFDTHAVAATIAARLSVSAETRPEYAVDHGLHRRSVPDVGHARAGLNNGYFDLYSNRAPVPQNSGSSGASNSLPSNYTLDMRRSSSADLSNTSPGQERMMVAKNKKMHSERIGDRFDRFGDRGERFEMSGSSPEFHVHACSTVDELVPMTCVSAQERWNAHLQRHKQVQEPQESMICAHCEEKFDVVEEYLQHLDAERVKHENFCPDPTCAFLVVGFRFRWLLRRHICNHHLKAYNSDTSKKLAVDLRSGLLKEFLSHVYVCVEPRCLRAFYRLDSLLRHQRLIHGPDKKRYRKERLLVSKNDESMFL